VFLHGGPGAGCSPEHRRFFNPRAYRIVLFDQRGAGRSTPAAEIRNNTTAHLIGDMERLRQLLGIDRWHVFGGSWGSTLALAYAEEYPQRCLSLTLRGIFLLRQVEIDWFLHGIRQFAPRAWRAFTESLPPQLRRDVRDGYWQLLTDPDPQIRQNAAHAWASFEAHCVSLRASAPGQANLANALRLATLEVHYMRNNRFAPDDLLLQRAVRLAGIPCAIVQGRYDLLCPPITAVALHEALPGSELHIIDDAGHSAFEPGIRATLINIMDGRAAVPPAAR
ncbi:MAG: prolyl aminopeptidase, partial [Sinobacteraceae bacterium]|nr:prolyl aminopeptidase [Nevskiaceae bacterium]